jgi:hypothetical protein
MIEFDEQDKKRIMSIFGTGIPNGKLTQKLRDLRFQADKYTLEWLEIFVERFFDEVTFGARYTEDEIEERINVVAESFPECVGTRYNGDLTAWLASDENRIYYLTNAIQNGNCNDGFTALANAQSEEILEIKEIGEKFLKWFAEEHDDGVDDDEDVEDEED